MTKWRMLLFVFFDYFCRTRDPFIHKVSQGIRKDVVDSAGRSDEASQYKDDYR